MESEGRNHTKYLPYLFFQIVKSFFIFYFPLRGTFFSFSLSLRSCQYQVPPWLSSLPLVTLCLFLNPGVQCLPRHICIIYVHSFSCDGSVVRGGRSLSVYQLKSQPGTLQQQVSRVNLAICKMPVSFLFPLLIIFLECFRWPLFL